MNGEYGHTSPIGQLKSTAGKFSSDVLGLIELQGKLLKLDARLAFEQSFGPLVMIAVGCVSVLASLPILILGASTAITHFFDLPLWGSQLLVSSLALAISIGAIAFGIRKLSKGADQFGRSKAELSKNIEWAKNLFRAESIR